MGMIQTLAKCPHCAQLRPQSHRKQALLFDVANHEPIEFSCNVCNRRWLATARDLANIKRILRGIRTLAFWVITGPVYLPDLSIPLMML